MKLLKHAMIALGSTTFVFIGWKIPETTKINNGLKTEITSMNFVFAWWHALNRYLPLPSPNAKGARGGCNLQGTGYSLSPTIFRSVSFAVNNKLYCTWSNYCIMWRNRQTWTSLNSKWTDYVIELNWKLKHCMIVV